MKKNHCYFGLYPVAADVKDNGIIPYIFMKCRIHFVKWLPEWSRRYTVRCYFNSGILSFNCGKRVCGPVWRTFMDIL